MKAIRCKSFGPPSNLVLEEIPSLSAGPKEVVVTVKACSLNFPDTLIIQGLYQFKPELPFTPGSDIAGIVKEVGSEVTHLMVGQEVVGFAPYGGLAEEVALPAKVCFPKPPQMDFPTAASFLMVYGTSYHGLKDRARLQKGETLLVLGASGGVGLAAVTLGKLMGAKVIAAASTDEKLALCKAYGADEAINYTMEDLKQRAKELTHGKGVDVVYDPVGGHFSELALRATARNGRFLVVGFTTGEIPKVPLNLALLKEAAIVGVFWGSFAMKEPKMSMANNMQLVTWHKEGKIQPYIHKTFKLEETPQALDVIMQRKAMGKLIVTME